ncbi:DUF523 domain-containing protein [Clostridium botulinum]|uniref:Uncharacterized protein n=1 Tax=Clostridium botulinum C/D str. DC5 TaxID=1443128 RepID=A0A0A0IDR9_CLOBO|nr:DUF523 domain-containing protein [Clostridium botulinum]KEI01342.1 hypothetical protein Z952_12450 [Clostridium botulinum C/D str. BKT75002]KEI12815.1 hypothetical protein Z954_04975 [Clostridium botulinum C/D str. BKT2873]KGM98653.1 hypothetical protein Z955_10840 [Clostridium botulinum C/D str. DC5]KOC50041.1 hypothetical protein ADU89_14920 [Clostridium botulinum]KOC52224.1 hypothetical protein ADU90_14765 [Clostridium botulinum]
MIVISACLCGIDCKYSGGNNLNPKALKLLKKGKAILVCPEQMGGLGTPRTPCEIMGGEGEDVLNGEAKVISKEGVDCTKEFLKGAYEALKIAKEVNAKKAIFKSKSPSCGFGKIYDGNFSGNKIDGNGVTSALFLKNGIKIVTEEEL